MLQTDVHFRKTTLAPCAWRQVGRLLCRSGRDVVKGTATPQMRHVGGFETYVGSRIGRTCLGLAREGVSPGQ